MKIEIEELRKIQGVGDKTIDRIYEYIQEVSKEEIITPFDITTIPTFTSHDITIYNGEALSLLTGLDVKPDLVLTDLPYGITKQGWDSIIPFDDMWSVVNKITKGAVVLFGNEPFSSALRMSNGRNYKYDWVWEKERLVNIAQVKKRAGKTVENICVFYKNQPTYNPQMVAYHGKPRSNKVKNGTMGVLCDTNTKPVKEYIDTGYRYPTQVLKFKRDILTSNLHPTQKPVALLEYLIRTYTNEGDTVLDFTAGSFSTAIACINTNRKFIGIELDEKYYKIGKKRIQDRLAELG